MRLSVSTIAFEDGPAHPATLASVRAAGFSGVDVAPTMLWPAWQGIDVASARAFGARYQDAGLEVVGAQSLLYGLTAPAVFGPPERRAALLEHLRRIAEPLAALGVSVLVFGSPGARDPGALDADAAFARARDLFAQIGDALAPLGLRLCVEPNPPDTGNRFVTTSAQGRRLAEAVASAGFGLHLDTGAMVAVGEDPAQAFTEHASVATHVHASEPGLGPFHDPRVDHAAAGAALRAAGYARWVCLEMRAAGADALGVALGAVAAAYGDAP